MKKSRLTIRSLWYYRKLYLAVFTGVVLSTAVLSGALIIGDSVRHSLIKLTDMRLGATRIAISRGD